MSLVATAEEVESTTTTTLPPSSQQNPLVDFVFTWIDGSDPEHQKLRNQFLHGGVTAAATNINVNQRRRRNAASTTAGAGVASHLHGSSYESCRWRNSGEINEAIRSVLRFAGSWAGNIYIVCSLGQKPTLSFGGGQKDKNEEEEENSFVGRHEIIVVQDSAICPVVPVFNSHAIEANLHKIPGLSEQFIYMCDDMFLGDYLSKEFFFERGSGRAKVFLGSSLSSASSGQNNSRSYMAGRSSSFHPAWYAARMNNFSTLDKVYGPKRRRDTIHQARALTKRACQNAWSNPIISTRLQKSSHTRFRSSTDVEPVWSLLLGRYRNRTIHLHHGQQLNPQQVFQH